MNIIFYHGLSGRSPIKNFVEKLNSKDRAIVLACLKNIEELGFECPRVQFRQIRTKLWEIKIRISNGGIRIFYVCINNKNIVLLHGYKKESSKAPRKEIEIAKIRMKEVINDKQNYS